MRILKNLADNVISIDFTNKNQAPLKGEGLSSNPFEIFVDENSTNLNDFCNALLSSVEEPEKQNDAQAGVSGGTTTSNP